MTAQLNPITEFREDHRKVRDLLLDIADAAEKGDAAKASASLGTLDNLVGPHFRYEEEALYQKLRDFLGEYVDQLIKEHDGAIDTARIAANLLSKPSGVPCSGRFANRPYDIYECVYSGSNTH